MYFNLNSLIIETNKKIINSDSNAIVFKYGEDNMCRVSIGEVVYFFDNQKLLEVLNANNINIQDEKSVHETLSKHIINQLMASTGKKVFPEIVSVLSDLIH